MHTLSPDGRRLASRLIVAAALLVFWGLALATALGKSPTSDEPAHFIRGYVLRQTGDLDLQLGHTPLSHRFIGLLLLTEPDAPDVRQLASWPTRDRLAIAAELLWQQGLVVERLFLLARLPIVWLALLLGAMMGSWALSWRGRYAMTVTLILFAFSPNLLAAGSLATTDLVTAVFYFATVFLWWRYWQRPGRLRWLATAVLLGLALAAKITAVLLLPITFLLTFVTWRRGASLWRRFGLWLGLLPVAGVVLWAVYGFEWARPDFWNAPLPAATYWMSWRDVLFHVGSGHRSFFMGELSGRGWWQYFAVTFLIKTPLVTLTLIAVGLLGAARRRAAWATAVFLLLPGVVLLAAATVSRLNIGYRHILPALPFLLVLAGAAVAPLRRHRLTHALLWLGLGWYVFSGVRQHPDYLAYFNEAVGGSAQGYRYLGDSNLDWGQDLALLADYVAAHPGAWRISYSGAADPGYYGLPAAALVDLDDPAFAVANPQPGRYAISVNHLQGILSESDLFDWFRRQTPVAKLGYSIFVYDVAQQAEGAWVAQCLDPVPTFTPEAAEAIVGRTALRHLFFDCRQTWLFPDDGAPGWLILPQTAQWWVRDLLTPAANERLRLVYRHDASDTAPSYEVYYWSGGDVAQAWAAGPAAGGQAAQGEDGRSVSLPVLLGETARLAGYAVSDGWNVLWQAAAETAEPLSLQGHLVTAAGDVLVADGLGFSSDQWRRGDWFVQRHRFPAAPPDAAYLETRLYNYVTAEAVGERLRLPAPPP